jgi:hypothetical protein
MKKGYIDKNTRLRRMSLYGFLLFFLAASFYYLGYVSNTGGNREGESGASADKGTGLLVIPKPVPVRPKHHLYDDQEAQRPFACRRKELPVGAGLTTRLRISTFDTFLCDPVARLLDQV